MPDNSGVEAVRGGEEKISNEIGFFLLSPLLQYTSVVNRRYACMWIFGVVRGIEYSECDRGINGFLICARLDVACRLYIFFVILSFREDEINKNKSSC